MLFSEVYSAYFNTVAAIIDAAVSGDISNDRIFDIISEKAFSESILSILPALENEDWLLINKNLQTPMRRSPQMPFTLLQKRWLRGLLSDPRMALFDIDTTGLEDVSPLFTYHDFVYFDQYSDGDPYTSLKYISHFRLVLTALKEHRQLHISYKNRHGNLMKGQYIPCKLEYSAKDDKFRLLSISKRFTTYINLARITQCELSGPYDENKFHSPKTREAFVSFRLNDERNALDRIMLHFSDCRKETIRLDDHNYHVKLWYEPQDKTELLIRILSFGPMIQVTEPDSFIKLIRERLTMQKNIMI